MKEFFESTYGERISPVYDEWYAEFEPEVIDTLSELAKGGRALEHAPRCLTDSSRGAGHGSLCPI